MLTTDPRIAIPVIPMKTHVSLLSNDTIDGLVYQYIFKQSKTCSGHLEASVHPGLLRCQECTALLAETATMKYLNDQPTHTRAVPQFSTNMASAWSIVDRLRRESETNQVCFALYLDVLVRNEHSLAHPGGLMRYGLQRFLFGLQPRLVCIAALQAVDAVDIEGYLRESEVTQ